MNAINERAITGTEPIPKSTMDQATVVIEEDDGDRVAFVSWPDPTFHERYVAAAEIDGQWMTIARGWKGQFVRSRPMWLPRPAPIAGWIREKIEEHLAREG